ncbi:uncharacterized protein LOC124115236 [Haliotis rufescens]|uniref:uncharacterized protein LOC124115236 n=1 Tax=Haliotis rufescens TaxID=6454 RepID=UPI00201F0147|nr:uncharacterized protein LOC124115236 [Haliotis rufescens]
MLQLCVYLFAVLLTESAAYKCCPPQRWKAKTFFTSLELNNNWPNFLWQNGEFYQDATNERSVEVFENRYHGTVKHLKIISDYKTKLRYRVNSDKNICSVEYNNEPFHTYCIPDSATNRFQVKLGFGDNSLEATAYYDESNLQNGKYQIGSWYFVNEACIPVQGDKIGLDKKSFLDTTIIASITTGFDDSIFDIPSICPTVVPPMERKSTNFFDVIRYKAAIEKL